MDGWMCVFGHAWMHGCTDVCYVRMYVCRCTCVRTYVNKRIRTHACCLHVSMYASMHVCTVCRYVRTYAPRMYVYVFNCMYACTFMCLRVRVCIYLPFFHLLSFFRKMYRPLSCLLACPPACLPDCLPACVRAWVRACVLACLLACLFACLLVCLLACLVFGVKENLLPSPLRICATPLLKREGQELVLAQVRGKVPGNTSRKWPPTVFTAAEPPAWAPGKSCVELGSRQRNVKGKGGLACPETFL